MKMLKDYMEGMLVGELEVITVSDFRAHPGDVFDQVLLGKSFCIKRKGEIVAFLVHPDNADVNHEVLPDGSCPTLGLDKGGRNNPPTTPRPAGHAGPTRPQKG